MEKHFYLPCMKKILGYLSVPNLRSFTFKINNNSYVLEQKSQSYQVPRIQLSHIKVCLGAWLIEHWDSGKQRAQPEGMRFSKVRKEMWIIETHVPFEVIPTMAGIPASSYGTNTAAWRKTRSDSLAKSVVSREGHYEKLLCDQQTYEHENKWRTKLESCIMWQTQK